MGNVTQGSVPGAVRAFKTRSVKRGRAPGVDRRCRVTRAQANAQGSSGGSAGRQRLEGDWLQQAPQVRVRVAGDRAKEQLGELAVLNARLAGQEAWQIRKRVEYLKRKRTAWQSVYDTACQQDAALTLSSLECAINEVEEALSDGRTEFQSISDQKQELLALQEDVHQAHERLHVTQARVDQNVKRLTELKAEAAEIARISDIPPAQSARERSTAVSSAPVATSSALEASAPAALLHPPGGPSGTAVSGSGGPAPAVTTRRSRGLASTLNLESGLRNFWYAVAFSSNLQQDTLVPIELFGETWVLFRDPAGAPACVQDQCAHRACPLSLGTVVDGQVQCAYHGWQFDRHGDCTHMPSTRMCKGVQVASLTTVEKDGFVWVWPGEAEPVPVPDTLPPDGFTLHAEIEVEVPVEHGLLMENLLDLAHAPFTHTSTFARGWPVPEAVKFHAQQALSGNWDPYPIDMSFEPPCMVVSMIGLKKPGDIERGSRAAECNNHLHQLHVCLPSRRGHTRLLYRMSLDFMPWIKSIPGIGMFWKYIAGQVLGEDLVLVQGQQERMQRGGDTWANPVSYDKLAVRYRRWRNEVGESTAIRQQLYEGQKMNAGDLFSVDEDDQVYADMR